MLGNAAKRQVYDIYGKEGLAAGLQVVPSGKSTEELKKDWEGFRTQQVRLARSKMQYMSSMDGYRWILPGCLGQG